MYSDIPERRALSNAEKIARWNMLMRANVSLVRLTTRDGRHVTLTSECVEDVSLELLRSMVESMLGVSAHVDERNQCDGCRRGLPLRSDGVHIGEGYDLIGCTGIALQSVRRAPRSRARVSNESQRELGGGGR